uniref:Uncharacterized protein n=3 Tax=Aegilops tauschii subsp. strangulata TaxID=200361 RepID=A0A453IY91_AEGTS
MHTVEKYRGGSGGWWARFDGQADVRSSSARLRIDAAAPSRTRCPNCISVFEKALKSYADNPAENVITPVLGTTFGFLDEAYDFYNL